MDQGDELHALFVQHEGFLHRVARWQLDKARLYDVDKDDVVNEVMIVVMDLIDRKKAVIAEVVNWPGFLTEITKNHVRNLRSKASRERLSALPDDFEQSYPVDDEITDGLVRRHLEQLFALLPEPWRSLLTLRSLYGLSAGQAAAALDVNPKKAERLWGELRRKVAVVRAGGRLRGLNARAFTDFARGVIALREGEIFSA
ncbi:sigma-70 family RNA polymerase sigma factor [Actinoplanes sp. NPDC026619]|uniref:sigma-70 family RNA polymerase sigma factor n=1 Tax=Actinoplanes sp. NPDC026619 TaxID=3155798 RepID=UPI0033E932E3